MCGIAGYFAGRNWPEEATLQKMLEVIAHRGPDSWGTWCDKEAGVALGHRRLSILDLSPLGHQPMQSASGRYVISFNGEVFNFSRLRPELERLGHSFRGGSDTEVMLAAIEQWGLEQAVAHFVGMFAFALFDRQERTLSLVRDRLGIKPLYYGQADCGFVFGSELKALRVHPGFDSRLDQEALALYFRHNYIPAPWSAHLGARKLPPGHILTLREGREPVLACYWNAAQAWERGAASPFAGTEHEAREALSDLLADAVGLRMMADVPLGAFLSGGVDSSLVVALMQTQSKRPVRTFSIGFAEKRFDESGHALAVANHLGTDHSELVLTQKDLLDIVPLVPHFWDEPFADSSQIATYAVCRMARSHVTVALSGDGGDELFFGYDRYFHAERWWRRLERIPRPLRTLAGAGGQLLPERLAACTGSLGRRFLSRLDAVGKTSFADFYKRLISLHTAPGLLLPLRGGEPRTALDLVSGSGDLFRDMSLWDTLMYLPDDILTKVDRASMAVSLEARVPLLDHRVVEFAASLPTCFKIRDGKGKHLLRQVLYQHVPPRIIDRPKMGFGIPVEEWLRKELRPWAEDILSTGRAHNGGLLDFNLVEAWWREMLGGAVQRTHTLWNVLMFLAWRQAVDADGCI